MNNRKFVAIILAVGLILLIGYVVGQGLTFKVKPNVDLTQADGSEEKTNETTQDTCYGEGIPGVGKSIYSKSINRFDAVQFAPAALYDPAVLALISLLAKSAVDDYPSPDIYADLYFMRDDTQLPIGHCTCRGDQGRHIVLNYPYSRYNDVLDILEHGNGRLVYYAVAGSVTGEGYIVGVTGSEDQSSSHLLSYDMYQDKLGTLYN